MAIYGQDKLAVVLMALTLGVHLHVDAQSDTAGDEHPPEAALRVGLIAKAFAGGL